jgi:hypothetical protein
MELKLNWQDGKPKWISIGRMPPLSNPEGRVDKPDPRPSSITLMTFDLFHSLFWESGFHNIDPDRGHLLMDMIQNQWIKIRDLRGMADAVKVLGYLTNLVLFC